MRARQAPLPSDAHWESELSSVTGPRGAPAVRSTSLHSRAAEVVAGSAPASLFVMPSEVQMRAQAMLDAATADAAPAKRPHGHRWAWRLRCTHVPQRDKSWPLDAPSATRSLGRHRKDEPDRFPSPSSLLCSWPAQRDPVASLYSSSPS